MSVWECEPFYRERSQCRLSCVCAQFTCKQVCLPCYWSYLDQLQCLCTVKWCRSEVSPVCCYGLLVIVTPALTNTQAPHLRHPAELSELPSWILSFHPNTTNTHCLSFPLLHLHFRITCFLLLSERMSPPVFLSFHFLRQIFSSSTRHSVLFFSFLSVFSC